jgi:predicted ATPase/DNA-binding CsgD family transcriptional regulator
MQHNTPPQLTSWIGREAESLHLTQMLRTPDCRLITLTGMGGIGKTHLALRMAQESQAHFADGVYFIPLQAVDGPAFVLSALTDGLHLSQSGPADALDQLLHYLHDKEVLLVLDSFEHLLDCAELLIHLLQGAPRLKLLITSRTVLNLRQEWVYAVRGLRVPQSATVAQVEEYSAVRLFVQRAQHVRPNFALDEQATVDGVVRICQLVEGMPLAIELAASWVKVMSCARIAAEIQQGLQLLTTSLRDVPPRHRSVEAVFAQSWRRLSKSEQDVFMRLSVFRGGCRYEAAAQVAGATAPILMGLVDHSLLRCAPDGRYTVHELLRQYGAEWLAASGDNGINGTIVDEVRRAHGLYFSRFLHERLAAMNGDRQLAACGEIQAELENIRQAWAWIVQTRDVDAMLCAEQSLYLFYQFQSRYQEGIAAVSQAVQSLAQAELDAEGSQALAQLLVDLGSLHIRLGQLEQADTALKQSAKLFARLGITPPPSGMATDPHLPLAMLSLIKGNYPQAIRLCEAVQLRSEAAGDEGNLMIAHYVLTAANVAAGRLSAAHAHGVRALALAEAHANRWFKAYCLNELGQLALARDDIEQAQHHYQASFTIRQQFGDREGMGVALVHLGEIAYQRDQLHKACQLFQHSLALYKDIGDQGGLARTLYGLARALCGLGDYGAARNYFRQALATAAQTALTPLILSIFVGVAELFLQTGAPEQAAGLLACSYTHPASKQETLREIQLICAKHKLSLDPPVCDKSCETVGEMPTTPHALSSSVDQLLLKLTAPQHPGAVTIRTNQALSEPLTPRELEVLHLLEQGLSNRTIGRELVLALGTVKTHVHNICGKLGATNRTEAVTLARRLHLL